MQVVTFHRLAHMEKKGPLPTNSISYYYGTAETSLRGFVPWSPKPSVKVLWLCFDAKDLQRVRKGGTAWKGG